jgi:hypothetical protein
MSPAPCTPGTPSSDNRPVRGARSCTLCRQMKARCNATEQYPNACSRCAHLGKSPCMIEPSFRRVNKRAYPPYTSNLTLDELRRSRMSSRNSKIQSSNAQDHALPRNFQTDKHFSHPNIPPMEHILLDRVPMRVLSLEQKIHFDKLHSRGG